MKEDPIDKAIVFAIKKHAGQKRDGGGDYFTNHLQRVGGCAIILGCDVDTVVAAYLHDTLEDTDTTYDELVSEFGKRVADLVNEVTHEGSKEKGYYFPRLKSKEAITIKLLDRASNISDMSAWNPSRQEHYLKRSQFWKTEDSPKWIVTDTSKVPPIVIHTTENRARELSTTSQHIYIRPLQ
jgi:(p)ppGpp synthase/HD superfamily hydrolase